MRVELIAQYTVWENTGCRCGLSVSPVDRSSWGTDADTNTSWLPKIGCWAAPC